MLALCLSPEEYRNIGFFWKLHPACVYGWLRVAAIETVVSEIDTFASSTGDFNINILDHMKKLENLLSLRTPDTLTTIDLAGSQGLEGMKVDTVKPQKIVFVFMPGVVAQGTTATLSTIVHSKCFCCISEQQCRTYFLVSVQSISARHLRDHT